MADSSITVGYQILVSAVGLTFLAGFLINAFIVAVNISEWKNGRPVSTADKVITSLGISRVASMITCLLKVILDDYFCRLGSLYVLVVMFTSIYSSLWMSTLLSVLFSLKISTLQNAFFLRLKILVLNRVLHLIVASVMMSFGYALMISLMLNVKISNNSTQEWHNNVSMGLRISIIVFLTTGPLFINFIASVLLIIYLYHHMSRMRSGRTITSQLDTYYKTIKFTIVSLFCSTVYIILQQTFNHSSVVFGLFGYNFFCQIPPTLHSIYLIYVTAKLRIQVSNMVHFWGRCGGPKAQVETVF